MKRIITIIILCLFVHVSKGQILANNKQIADAYFNNKDYYAAANFYKKALNISSDTTALHLPYNSIVNKAVTDKSTDVLQAMLFNLAEASRLYHNFKDAEQFYGMISDYDKYPTAKYWHGVSLNRNQKFDLANLKLREFIQEHPNSPMILDAQAALATADFAAREVKNPTLVQLTKMGANINGLGSNYATAMFNEGLFFTSSRPVAPEGETSRLSIDNQRLPVIKAPNPYINALYFVPDVTNGDPSNIVMANIKRPAGMEFGAPSVSANGNVIYFTAWSTSDKEKKYSIWTSKKEADNVWSAAAKLNSIVNEGANAKQPFATQDGKYLIFSSDRPGGFGGYDLWYVPIRADQSTGQPVNLGVNINTKKDEEAPYFNSLSNRLIYSTNGKVGFGGLDLFQSFGDFAKWTPSENLGYPFNSSKDDVYFSTANAMGTEGFISSDRSSECCLEVFKFVAEEFTVSGMLSDCNSSSPLQAAEVVLNFEGVEMKTTTDEKGAYSFKLVARRGFQLSFSKPNYFSKTVDVTQDEMFKSDILLNKDMCLTPFKVDEPIVLKNIYFEFNSSELNVPSTETLDDLVKILQDNATIKIELSAHTDSVGSDEYNFDLSGRRASACVDYIISKGISSDRITAKGYGESVPKAPNSVNGKDNPQGRALNRRTEFKVLEEKKIE